MNTCPEKLSQLPYSRACFSASGKLASAARYPGSLPSRAGLSNTLEGMNTRARSSTFWVPSGSFTGNCSTMGVPGGAGVMNRAFTQPCPTPPGLVVARRYTRVPGPVGRLRLIM